MALRARLTTGLPFRGMKNSLVLSALTDAGTLPVPMSTPAVGAKKP
jgi:hypothetical protein